MHSQTKNIIGMLAVIIALGLAAFLFTKNRGGDGVACTMEAKLCPDGSAVGREGPNCEFKKCPDLLPTQQAEDIKVYAPFPGQAVTSPLVIVGEARVFENNFQYRIKDGTGLVIKEGFSAALSPDIGQFGPFSVAVEFPTSTATGFGRVEVFNASARDGAEENLVSIPVVFEHTPMTLVQVFWGNQKADPQVLDCTKVFRAYRVVPITTGVARAALEELLRGPTNEENLAGYITSIPSGVRINSIEVTKGAVATAKADFSSKLEEGVGGSCRVTAIRSQIESALKQFPLVDEVEISIEGRTEDILQP